VKSRFHGLNLLLDALCQRNRSDLATKSSKRRNKDSCRILMKGMCEDGRLNVATHLLCSTFWRISQRGSGEDEDIVVYRTLSDALCDIGQVEDALEILGKILMKEVKAPKRCRDRLDLSQCNNGEDMKPTKRLINEALIRGGVPRLGSHSAMAVDLYREGKTGDQTGKVLDKTQERGYKDHHLGLMKRRSPHCEEKVVRAVKPLM